MRRPSTSASAKGKRVFGAPVALKSCPACSSVAGVPCKSCEEGRKVIAANLAGTRKASRYSVSYKGPPPGNGD